MKRYLNIFIALSLSFTIASSCQEEMENLFPKEYDKVLSIKDINIVELTLTDILESSVSEFVILKGGGKPDSESIAHFRVMTEEEACSEWHYSKDQIAIIQKTGFNLEETITISETENYKKVRIEFNPAAISKMQKQEDETWILPLALESETDNINPNMGKILYSVTIRPLGIEWKDLQETTPIEITYLEKEVPLIINTTTELNPVSFTAEIDLSNGDKLVSEYNKTHGTDYTLLPKSAFSVQQFSFKVGETSSMQTMTFKREGLQSDKCYILPLDMKLSSDNIHKPDALKYILISNPKYCYETLNQTEFSIAFANSECGWGWIASNLIDGEKGNGITTAWTSKYDGDIASPDVDDYVYSFDPAGNRWIKHPQYPFCSMCRALSDVYIVIDMKQNITLGAVGFGKWSDEWGDRVMSACKVDIADDFIFASKQDGGSIEDYSEVSNGNIGWTPALDCTGISTDKIECQWFNIEPSVTDALPSGRFLRLNPYGTTHENKYDSAFTEIYVKKVISINGIKVTE